MRPYISSMSNGVRNRGISWSGIGRTLLVEILVLLALSFVVVRYLEWSSEINQAEFVGLIGQLAFDPNQFPVSSVAVHPAKGQTACYRKAN